LLVGKEWLRDQQMNPFGIPPEHWRLFRLLSRCLAAATSFGRGFQSGSYLKQLGAEDVAELFAEATAA
jgi:hypothetical protein